MIRNESSSTNTEYVRRAAWVPSLDVLRANALFLVVASHFSTMLGSNFPEGSTGRMLSDYLAPIGFLGTNTFFLLSAYFFCRSLSGGASWIRTVGRRMARIYPGFALLAICYVLLAPLAPSVTKIPRDPVDAFFYLLANFLLLPGIFPITPLVTIAWSLSYIVFSYLAFGVLYRVLPLTQWSPAKRAVLWTALAVLIAAFSQSRLILFPLGALITEVRFLRHHSDIRLCAAAGLAGISLLFVSQTVLVTSLGLFLLTSAWVSFPYWGGLFTGRYTTALAENAYAAFLCHGFVFRAIRLAEPSTITVGDLAALAIAGFGLTFVAAYAANTLVLGPVRQQILEARPAIKNFLNVALRSLSSRPVK